MAWLLRKTSVWTAWSMLFTGLCAAAYTAVAIPAAVGTVPHLAGNLTSLAAVAIAASLLSPACIIPWALIAYFFPCVERSYTIFGGLFVAWVCFFGAFTTSVVYREEVVVIHLVPFALGAFAIMSPRFFISSLKIAGGDP